MNNRKALIDAATFGNLEELKKQVASGIDLNFAPMDDYSVLYYAMKVYPHEPNKPVFDLVHYLVEKGADINKKFAGGETPFFTACAEGHAEVVEYMIDKGADINTTLDSGWNALHFVGDKTSGRPLNFTVTTTVNGEEKVITDPDEIRKIHGSHPDDEYMQYVHIANILIKNNINFEARNNNRQTPLFSAAGAGSADICKLILEKGGNPNYIDKWGLTPLHYSTRLGAEDTVQVLIEHGANINAQDDIGFTPLHEATENRHADLVKLLLELGAKADLGLKKKYQKYEVGFTPLDIGKAKRLTKVVELLEKM